MSHSDKPAINPAVAGAIIAVVVLGLGALLYAGLSRRQGASPQEMQNYQQMMRQIPRPGTGGAAPAAHPGMPAGMPTGMPGMPQGVPGR